MTNRQFVEDPYFRSCCDAAGVGATRRQASKFRSEKGLSFKIGKSRVKKVDRELKEVK